MQCFSQLGRWTCGLDCLTMDSAMKIIGLMSGTSADGVDAALIDVKAPEAHPGIHSKNITSSNYLRSKGIDRSPSKAVPSKVKLLAFRIYPWSKKIREKILEACDPRNGGGSTELVAWLNFEIARKFAAAANKVVALAGLKARDIDFIGSHGQTIFHAPPHCTLQIGDGCVISKLTGLPVVSDFRPADMALGGQAAPLVPIADFIMFQHPKRTRAVQNIGGIANVTILPAGASKPESLIAFDTGPGNMMIDAAVSRITNGAKKFDNLGRMAKSSAPDEELVKELLRHPFFRKKPPKSTGREEFGEPFVDALLKAYKPRSMNQKLKFLASLTSLTARSIAAEYGKLCKREGLHIDEVILSGGGAKNETIVAELKELLEPVPVVMSDRYGVPSGAREAMSFALLARETILMRPGNVTSATGASRPAVLGKVSMP